MNKDEKDILRKMMNNPIETMIDFLRFTEISSSLKNDEEFLEFVKEKGIDKEKASMFVLPMIGKLKEFLEDEFIPSLTGYDDLFDDSYPKEFADELIGLALKKAVEFTNVSECRSEKDEEDDELIDAIKELDILKMSLDERLNIKSEDSYDSGKVLFMIKSAVNVITKEVEDVTPYIVKDGYLVPFDFDAASDEVKDAVLEEVKKKNEDVYKVFCRKYNVKSEDDDLEIKKKFFKEVFGVDFGDDKAR